MAMKEKDQPARDKPNESENQPQFASEDEASPERELGSSDDEDTEKVPADSISPRPNGRPGVRAASRASDPNKEAEEALDDERRPPNADD
jgi:hypothetical protein